MRVKMAYNVIFGFFINYYTGEGAGIFAGAPGDILARYATEVYVRGQNKRRDKDYF